LQNQRPELPQSIWRGIPVVSERWHGADSIEVEVDGDGADLRALFDQRTDIFSVSPP